MNVLNQVRGGGTTLLGLQLALGLVVGGWALGSQIKATRLADRYVSVRGLAERNVKSDLAIWPIDYKEAGDDLASLYAKTEADRKVILQFLGEQGIQPSEIQMGIVRVVDNQANEFGNFRPPAAPLYRRAANHRGHLPRGSGCGRRSEDRQPGATGHRPQ